MSRTEVVQVRVDPEVKAAIEAEARRLRVRATEVYRRILGEWVSRRNRILVDTPAPYATEAKP